MLVFVVIWLAPGGEMEHGLSRLLGGEGKRARAEASFSLSPTQVLELEESYQRDKSLPRAYGEWLGVLPRDIERAAEDFPADAKEVEISVPGTVHVAKVRRDDADHAELIAPEGVDLSAWQVRLRTPAEAAQRWKKWMKDAPLKKPAAYRAVLFRPKLDGLLQGSLGNSSKYQDSVWSMILQRVPTSLFYGLISMVIIYGVCLPLGIVKAIKHRSWLDNVSSFAVFAGYAVPGYALGSLLVVFLGAKLGWFPIRGFTGDDFDTLSAGGKVKDLLQHAAMPLTCYLIGSFAFMTLIVKNNLMDNLAADYVRTAVAKGVSYPSAVFRHAFRNSIIPVASTFGNNVSLLVAGSILIERVFDINGFGLLQYNALLERDRPLTMGVLFVSATLMLIGNVLSDLCVAMVDPRVSFK